PRVEWPLQHRRAVEQVEDVEVERQVRAAELERLLDARIHGRDRVELELIHRAHEQHILVREYWIAGVDAALIERLRVARTQHPAAPEIQAPGRLIQTVRRKLILR